MDINKIKELIELFKESQLSRLEVEDREGRINLEKVISVQETLLKTTPEVLSENKRVDQGQGNVIKSPLVGIFYAASAEGKLPYVKKGDRVSQGDVLCVIEAMKTMNEVRSDVSGVVQDILVSNNDSVEYHQPLFVIGS